LKFWKQKGNIILVLLLITGLLGVLLGASGSASKLSSLALGSTGLPFSDNFDNGNLDAWDYNTQSSISTFAYSGSYSADLTDAVLYKYIDDQSNLYVDFQYYVNDLTSGTFTFVFTTWDSNWGNQAGLGILVDGSGPHWVLFCNDDNRIDYSVSPVIHQWNDVQIHENSDGAFELWINGVQVSGEQFNPITGIGIFRIGPGISSTYYDSFVADTSYITFVNNPTPTPNPTGQPTPTPTPIPTVNPSPTPIPTPPVTVQPTKINYVVFLMGVATSVLSGIGLIWLNRKF
jgi:hypothetical protein